MTVRADTQEQVERYFKDIPVMVRIARCESHFTQFNKNGSVYRGVLNHKDVGVTQINEYWNLATARKLGFNIYTLKGNMGFARWLYTHRGTAPWGWSRKCWDI